MLCDRNRCERMMVVALGMVLVAASVVAIIRWQWGLYALVLVAMVQDPVRKLTPGAPGYLVLATVPVWCAVMIGALRSGNLSWERFREDYPGFTRMLVFYAAGMIVPAVLSATYSPGSWQLTLLGIYTQFALIAGFIMGAFFPDAQGDVERLMAWYCVLAGIAMIGAPLERLGIGTASGLVGTSSLGANWMTQRTGVELQMISGLFRSPDVMGWHAATLIMFGTILAVRSAAWQRIGWAALAGWGGIALMFCARRKMIAMMLPYALIIALLLLVFKRARHVMPIMFCILVAGGVWWHAYQRIGPDVELEEFYGTTLDEAAERMEQHGLEAVLDTIQQSGFWGHGLGMAAQGTHHIKCERPRIWQESGPSMLAAEMGVPGLVLFSGVVVFLGMAMWQALRVAAGTQAYFMYFGLVAIVVANGIAGIVSAQIFGDPFVGLFLPFLIGLCLSGSRLNVPERLS